MAGARSAICCGGGADGVERGEVQRDGRRPRVGDLGMNPRLGVGEGAVVACGEDDVRTGGGECPGGFAPEAGGGAGDHAGLAGQVDAVDHLSAVGWFIYVCAGSSPSRHSGVTTSGSHASSTIHLHIRRIGSIASCGAAIGTLHA